VKLPESACHFRNNESRIPYADALANERDQRTAMLIYGPKRKKRDFLDINNANFGRTFHGRCCSFVAGATHGFCASNIIKSESNSRSVVWFSGNIGFEAAPGSELE
jgi:hypothetical protein